MANDRALQPLSSNFKIVDENGFPNDYFIRWAQQRQIDLLEGLTAEQVQQLIDDWAAARHINTTAPITGGGPLSSDLTLAHAASGVAAATYGDATHVPQITVDAKGHVTAAVNVSISGGGGGSGGQLMPYPSANGIRANAASSGLGTPVIFVRGAFAQSTTPVNGIILPVVNAGSPAYNAVPIIYANGNPLTSWPNVGTGAPLAATGPAVALANNSFKYLPLSAPFTPVLGNWYWVGITLSGGSGTPTLASLSSSMDQYFGAGGAYNPAPAVLPAMTAGTGNNCAWWTV